MLENDRMETASTKVTSIWCRNDIGKSTWRTHQYFVDFESQIHVEISTSNRCHNFHVDSPFKIDVISSNFPRAISTSNRWIINEDVSIGLLLYINELYIDITKSRSFAFSASVLFILFMQSVNEAQFFNTISSSMSSALAFSSTVFATDEKYVCIIMIK